MPKLKHLTPTILPYVVKCGIKGITDTESKHDTLGLSV